MAECCKWWVVVTAKRVAKQVSGERVGVGVRDELPELSQWDFFFPEVLQVSREVLIP